MSSTNELPKELPYELLEGQDQIEFKYACNALDFYIEMINETFIALCDKSGIKLSTIFFYDCLSNGMGEVEDILKEMYEKEYDLKMDHLTVPYYERIKGLQDILIAFSKSIERLCIFEFGVERVFDFKNIRPLDMVCIENGVAILKNSRKDFEERQSFEII